VTAAKSIFTRRFDNPANTNTPLFPAFVTPRHRRAGQVLWKNHQIIVYQPQQSGGIAGLVANAIVAAIAKAAPNYMPLAPQANDGAINVKGTGLPAGPYDGMFGKDSTDF
jgi:hypothetical protein